MTEKLKVLLFSHYFYPSLGGIETVSLTLAQGFLKNNIACKVITTTPDNVAQFDFDVIRNPSLKQKIELVKWADLVLFNGVSLALQPWIILFGKPFVWIHAGYQVSCVDGLGWVDGIKAPLTPFKSIMFHIRLKGLIAGTKQGFKLLLKRFTAKYIVTRNVAITNWIQNIQPLPRQVRIYNPFPLGDFFEQKSTKPEYDFLYLGRIVSEKGVATLLKAFAKVTVRQGQHLTLLIVGSGNWEVKMKDLAAELNIANNVFFAGKKSGRDLADWVAKGGIAIVPSEWYEPMGGVCLELMAAGKNLIVSDKGGLKECVGNAGITFPNGDDEALADCMLLLLNDPVLRQEQVLLGQQQVKLFNPDIFVLEYIDLLKGILKRT